MDMSLSGGTWLARALSPRGLTAISHIFVMDWASVWIDIALGLLVSGALAAWVPHRFWIALFLAHDPIWSRLAGPLIGPLVAVLSFVCSVGNVPLAAGYVVEVLFGAIGLVPADRRAGVLQASVGWNHTTVLNVVALVVAALLVWRFVRTGGPPMLRRMGGPAGGQDEARASHGGGHAHACPPS